MFEVNQKVLFRHCDPAGIVFFPRYFEMMNDCIEAFFDEVLGLPFEKMLQTGGVPTAQIQTRFVAPSRHGDDLALKLSIMRVGSSSLDYRMQAVCGDQLRFDTAATLVNVNAEGRSSPWPDTIGTKLIEIKDITQ